jgi:hypothetical protein
MDDVAARVFGQQYAGRRYLRVDELIAIGIARNRDTLRNLVRRGELPPPIRMGRVLLFETRALAARLLKNDEGAPASPLGRPADSDDPLAADRNDQRASGCVHRPTS